MLSNIGEPLLVYPIGSEVALHEVITHRRASLMVAAFALRNDRLDTGNLTEPPDATLGDLVPEIVQIISEHPVPALGVFLMEPTSHAVQVFFLDFTG